MKRLLELTGPFLGAKSPGTTTAGVLRGFFWSRGGAREMFYRRSLHTIAACLVASSRVTYIALRPAPRHVRDLLIAVQRPVC